jgi:transaldolase
VQTMPYEWQVKVNRSGLEPVDRIAEPVPADVLRELVSVPEFVRAYEPDGISVAEFDTFGPTRRTLRSFITAWYDFVAVVRDTIVPDPDVVIVGATQ